MSTIDFFGNMRWAINHGCSSGSLNVNVYVVEVLLVLVWGEPLDVVDDDDDDLLSFDIGGLLLVCKGGTFVCSLLGITVSSFLLLLLLTTLLSLC